LHQDIPNSQFFVFKNNEAVFLPATADYAVSVTATGNGTFSLSFTLTDSAGSPAKVISFNDVPITVASRAQLSLKAPLVSEVLQLDVNGDGNTDFVIKANQLPPTESYIAVLRSLIQSFHLKPALNIDLDVILRAALDALQRGRTTPVQGQLAAFKAKLLAQSGKLLTASQVAVLIEIANKATASFSR